MADATPAAGPPQQPSDRVAFPPPPPSALPYFRRRDAGFSPCFCLRVSRRRGGRARGRPGRTRPCVRAAGGQVRRPERPRLSSAAAAGPPVAGEDPGGAFPGRARLAGEAGPEAGPGHRRRGAGRGSPMVVELGEVDGEGRILEPAVGEPGVDLDIAGRAGRVVVDSRVRRGVESRRPSEPPQARTSGPPDLGAGHVVLR